MRTGYFAFRQLFALRQTANAHSLVPLAVSAKKKADGTGEKFLYCVNSSAFRHKLTETIVFIVVIVYFIADNKPDNYTCNKNNNLKCDA